MSSSLSVVAEARGSRPVLVVPPVFSDAGGGGGETIESEKEKKKCRKFDHFLSSGSLDWSGILWSSVL